MVVVVVMRFLPGRRIRPRTFVVLDESCSLVFGFTVYAGLFSTVVSIGTASVVVLGVVVANVFVAGRRLGVC